MSNSTKQQILRLVRDSGERGIENYKLSEITLGYRGRLSELRQDGYDIRAKRVYRNGKASGTYVYYIESGEPKKVTVTDESAEIPSLEELDQVKLIDTPKKRRFF